VHDLFYGDALVAQRLAKGLLKPGGFFAMERSDCKKEARF